MGLSWLFHWTNYLGAHHKSYSLLVVFKLLPVHKEPSPRCDMAIEGAGVWVEQGDSWVLHVGDSNDLIWVLHVCRW